MLWGTIIDGVEGMDRERAGKFLGSIPQLVKYATMVH